MVKPVFGTAAVNHLAIAVRKGRLFHRILDEVSVCIVLRQAREGIAPRIAFACNACAQCAATGRARPPLLSPVLRPQQLAALCAQAHAGRFCAIGIQCHHDAGRAYAGAIAAVIPQFCSPGCLPCRVLVILVPVCSPTYPGTERLFHRVDIRLRCFVRSRQAEIGVDPSCRYLYQSTRA